jgi:putative peptidoglycan lipid II flippase
MIPGVLAAGVWQLNLLIDTTISSYLPTGSITYINLADRLNQFPLSVLGISIGTVLLPILSRYMVSKNYENASNELQRGMLFSMFLTMFSTTVFIALSEPTVAVIYQRGKFDYEHVVVTADALVGFALGLPAYVTVKIFSSLYFAAEDNITPVIFAIISVVMNAVLLCILVPIWKYFGLALCTSVSAVIHACMLVYSSRATLLKSKFSDGFANKIFAQLCASIVTYMALLKIKDIFWSAKLGDSFAKWPIYFVIFMIAMLIFFFSAVLFLKLLKHEHWRLWEKSSW